MTRVQRHTLNPDPGPELPPIPSPARILDTVVDQNASLCRGHWRLVLRAPTFPPCEPGQFINILCRADGNDRHDHTHDDGPSTTASAFAERAAYLRRPFSIAELQRDGNAVRMEILHHVVGPGTAWMAARQPGDRVNILGPVGSPFRIDANVTRAVLVGGGIGIPPLIWLARVLAERGVNALVLYGVRNADAMPLRVDTRAADSSRRDQPELCIDEFSRNGVPAIVCTDDGSIGRRGFVTDALAARFDSHPPDARTTVFTCGPDVMMRSVAEICARSGAACQVCLERVMGCSLGTCQSCVVPVADPSTRLGWRYRLCCTDGPVFDASAVLWSTPRS